MGLEDAAPLSSPENGREPEGTGQARTPAREHASCRLHLKPRAPSEDLHPRPQPSNLAHLNAPHAVQPDSHFRLSTIEKRKKRATGRK